MDEIMENHNRLRGTLPTTRTTDVHRQPQHWPTAGLVCHGSNGISPVSTSIAYLTSAALDATGYQDDRKVQTLRKSDSLRRICKILAVWWIGLAAGKKTLEWWIVALTKIKELHRNTRYIKVTFKSMQILNITILTSSLDSHTRAHNLLGSMNRISHVHKFWHAKPHRHANRILTSLPRRTHSLKTIIRFRAPLGASPPSPAGDIHHGSQFEQLCDEEAQIW